MITLYSKEHCVQCDATKRELNRLNIDYKEVDLLKDEAAVEYVKELGYSAAPVVVTDTDHWSGFRPDKLAGLPKAAAQAEVSPAPKAPVFAAEPVNIGQIVTSGHDGEILPIATSYRSEIGMG